MANREACEVWIEQEIDSGLEAGKTPYSIGKEISDWVAKLFEVRISPHTIRTRAQRQQSKNDSFESKESKTHAPSPSPKTQPTSRPVERFESGRGGAREGSGRPLKKEVILQDRIKNEKTEDNEKIISDEFKKAFDAMLTEIKNAKRLGWATTSKEAALQCIEILFDVTTIR